MQPRNVSKQFTKYSTTTLCLDELCYLVRFVRLFVLVLILTRDTEYYGLLFNVILSTDPTP
jgi:hypothetical protein